MPILTPNRWKLLALSAVPLTWIAAAATADATPARVMPPAVPSSLPHGALDAASNSRQPETFTLTIVVSGADREGGAIGAALYASSDGFPGDQAKAAQTSMRPRTASVDSIVFRGLVPGQYAVSVFHDTNSNGKLDANMFGMPKEPWGVTRNVRPRLRAPRFDETKVSVSADTRVDVRVER